LNSSKYRGNVVIKCYITACMIHSNLLLLLQYIRATREALQAKRLKDELANIDQTRLDKLSDANVKLSSVEALRILERFDLVDASRKQQVKEIEALQSVEDAYRAKLRERQDVAKLTQKADRSVENAVQREVLAQQRLAEAQREVLEAKLNLEDSLKQQREATAKEKAAANDMEKASLALDTNAGKIRVSLKKKEAESLQRRAAHLKKESERLEEVAEKLRSQAEKIKAKSDRVKKERERKQTK